MKKTAVRRVIYIDMVLLLVVTGYTRESRVIDRDRLAIQVRNAFFHAWHGYTR